VAGLRDGTLGTISYTTEDSETHTVDSNPACPVMRQIGCDVEQTVASIFGE
jgi:hypothetical protein